MSAASSRPRLSCSPPCQHASFPSAAYDCPPCYNPRTKSRFWGFATVYVDADSLADVSDAGSDTRLRRFDALGYSYQLLAPQPNGGEAVLAASAVPPADAVETRVTTPSDLPWRLLLAPASGWAPPWRAPMLAAAAALGAAVGALTCLILVSRRRLLRAVSTLKVQGAGALGPGGRAGRPPRQPSAASITGAGCSTCPLHRWQPCSGLPSIT